ncbi:hypothetical protein K1719_041726 [Acacia pycnantha]|nr:hypothetical protein K1719_041726 [Acacia pycnantha]
MRMKMENQKTQTTIAIGQQIGQIERGRKLSERAKNGELGFFMRLVKHDRLGRKCIPDEIGDLSNFEFLDLHLNTNLPPTQLPVSFTKLKKVKTFRMKSMNLIGKIPESIGEMVSLEELDLSENGLNGQIPGSLFALKNLTILYLWNNKLSGEIPTEIEALNPTVLDVSENFLTGKIPDGLGKLKKLKGFYLQMNQLSGEIPESLAHLPALVDYSASLLWSLFANRNLSGYNQ